jgi:S-formylglutathione hydrolase FrmB
MRRATHFIALACALVAAVALPTAAQAAWPTCTARTTPIHAGVREVHRTTAGRLVTLTLHSTAMGDDQPVDVLLPKGYAKKGTRRYPVLYLLHGAGGNSQDWMQHGAEDIVGDLPVIVVMPDGGSDGSYSDWAAIEPGRKGGFPAYETYDVDELIPFVDGHWRTQANVAGRAIAGLSMGGHGAVKLASEHPGTFGYAGTFSGAVHPGLPLYQSFIKQCTWGDPSTDQVVWQDNDPVYNPANLRGTRLFLRVGSGIPGPLDPAGTKGTDIVETVVRQMNDAFLAALKQASVPVDAKEGDGTHTWPYWQQDLREFVPWLAKQLKKPVKAPRTFDVASAHATVDAWGWRLRTHRTVREFLYLRSTGANALQLTGSGRVDVRTPPRYRSGRRYRVTVAGRARTVKADRRGRLSFPVSLGVSHTRQQTVFTAAGRAGWRSATVKIGSAR